MTRAAANSSEEIEPAAGEHDEVRNRRLYLWLLRNLNREGQMTAEVTIGHVTVTGKVEPLGRFQVQPPCEDAEIQKLANALDVAANEDAEALSGHQKYKIQTIGKLGTALSTMHIRVDADGEGDSEGLSEPPTAVGLTSQAMRHAEGYAKHMIASQQAAFQALQRTVSRQAEMMEKLLRDRMEMHLELERLSSQRHERELEIRQLEFKQKVEGDVFDQIKLLGPIVVNKLAGRKLLPEKKIAEHVLVTDFCASLTREQILEKLLPALDHEQRTLFLEIYEAQRNDKAYDGQKVRRFMASIRGDQVDKLRGFLGPTQQIALLQLFETCSKPQESGGAPPPAANGHAKGETANTSEEGK